MSAADLLDFSPEVAEARSAKKADRRARIDDHHPWHALPAQCRDGARRRARGARDGRRSGDDRGHRRPLSGSASRRRGDRPARPALGRRRQGLAARSRAGRGAQRLGGHDGRGDDVHRRARGHRNLRHRRHRRRAPRAPRRRSTFPPIWSSFRAPASPSSAPAPNRSSTSARRSSSWKPRESRSSATAPTNSRPSTPARPASGSNIAATGFTISPA